MGDHTRPKVHFFQMCHPLPRHSQTQPTTHARLSTVSSPQTAHNPCPSLYRLPPPHRPQPKPTSQPSPAPHSTHNPAVYPPPPASHTNTPALFPQPARGSSIHKPFPSFASLLHPSPVLERHYNASLMISSELKSRRPILRTSRGQISRQPMNKNQANASKLTPDTSRTKVCAFNQTAMITPCRNYTTAGECQTRCQYMSSEKENSLIILIIII